MSLFDYLDISYDLPYPENATEEHKKYIRYAINIDNFQTKDLDCFLNTYFIDRTGLVYEKIEEEYKQFYVHQHVECYTYVDVPPENTKYFLNYDIKFTDGKVKKVTVLDWKPVNRTID